MGGKAKGGRRALLVEAQDLARDLSEQLLECGAVRKIAVAGSTRRKILEVGDVDMVIIPGPKFNEIFSTCFGTLVNGKPSRTTLIGGVQIDFLLAGEDSWGAAMMHFTGPASLNIRQRARAKQKGMLLNEKGLWKDGELIAGKTEEEVYEALGLTFIKPEDRK